ncbi:SNF2-related protein [Brasilonema sp. UFV-L1]|uniref:SNF2-related protein n=1 Tax=Brasilonema sp. UFV-L1 TaxID=2234130 RepID=UPI00145E97C9|nr:SNF2-related protein [Brasilonema sp. UFV-L1]NMG07775.1 helicase [Brasilonema sp. UFV-L1]
MAILHGSWLIESQDCLFVWGETWRTLGTNSSKSSLNDVSIHPLAMTPLELVKWLHSRNITIARMPQTKHVETLHITSRQNGKMRKTATAADVSLPTHSQIVALPTHILENTDEGAVKNFPAHSATFDSLNQTPQYLQPWVVEGFCLNPEQAIQFLTSLPLNVTNEEDSFLGGDLRFWVQVARWSLDLISRSKFLPIIQRQPDYSVVAKWQALLDSAQDGTRLEKFSQLMPLACRTYQGNGGSEKDKGDEGENNSKSRSVLSVCAAPPKGLAKDLIQNSKLGVSSSSSSYPHINLPLEPQELLLGFLNSTIDAQIRAMVGSKPVLETRVMTSLPATVRQWLHSLTATSNTVNTDDPFGVERLEAVLKAWTMPLQYQIGTKNQFRTCFVLRSKESAGETNWTLAYFLQAADDPNFIVDATTIWNHPLEKFVYQNRTIEQPQETFLRGLGLASRLYPPIAASLETPYPQSCHLNPIQAYEFIKSVAWRFEDNGLGIVLPPSLANRDGWANRLGLKITAQTSNKKQERLGLQSLLNFKWELAIGGQTISKAEFDRLVALNSPLVEINGEWVELRSQDIKTAQTFFASRKEQMALSLEDALRISTGDTQTVEKLPVVSFEASGALQELISALTNNKAVEPLPIPTSFQGKLRPYQERGMAWLSFLERWGLGACLADDMGLGKCLVNDTLVYVNGGLRTAEEIWQTYAGETEFDGEGFWADPTEKLLANSIDEETGKIVQAPIRQLYRQQVCEKLRKVTLQDGSSITITRRHKLLTSKGWTNELKVGDYVCVPAKMLWEGQPEDPDLVKFLAWQIAEGNEPLEHLGSVRISQKDKQRLQDLLETFQRIGERYNLKLNRPVVCPYSKRDYYQLVAHSKAYRLFLEAKGYKWGKLSAEKSIPPFIMQADLDTVRIFLQNYFDAESAVVSSMRSIEIATASPQLIQQLSTLLRRFGIWLRISPKQKCATNGTRTLRTYYIGVIGGNSARRFLQEIGYGIPEKQGKLEEICQRESNTNVEGIPASDIVAQTVTATGLPLRHFGMHNTVYINGSQQFSRNSLQQVIAGMNRIIGINPVLKDGVFVIGINPVLKDGVFVIGINPVLKDGVFVISGEAQQEYQLLKASKWTTQTLEAYARLDVEQLSLTRQSVQHLLDQEVFYCKIESIEDVEYEGWVYDFEVSEHHNFVANNIICHNTIQFIAFLLHLKEQETLEKPTLLVCPTSVLGNWEREVKKFAPTLKVLQYHGDKRPKGKAFVEAANKHDIVITSYSLIHRDVKTLQGVSWQIVVLDEAQNVKNSEAKQSQAVRQIESTFRIALTGTPVENRLQELWSILDFLNPGYLGNRQFFQRRFAIPIEKYGDAASLNQLRSLVQPFILRRLKTDREIIQDLPEKQEMTVFCGLSAQQAQLYQRVVEESLAEIEEAEGLQRRGMILALLVKLKQICNHPSHYLKQDTLEQHHSGKLQRLQEMLEMVIDGGDRALIFTQFAEWGKLLKPYLEKQIGRETLFLYGSTQKKQREEMVDRFQHDPQGPPIMILSLKAGGVGLNLTRANHVFHFDRWWNPAVENQATDRVFRIGQTRNVQVHKFVCTGTLEEKINDMIESKKQLAEQVVGAGEDWLTEMDTDQLRNLLILDRSAVIEEETE